jgi:serine/threonine-protein kinase HipA
MHVGEDVPGAAQFITPERLEAIQSADELTVQWLTEDELAQRLQQLRADISAVRLPGDIGKMSLPGAQAKTALYWDQTSNRWGVPGGRTPTTHIIKPCVPGFDGMVENEHMVQELAARLGLPAAVSRVLKLDQAYIVIERYDRLPSGSGNFQRIHQEDMCQALIVLPTRKYQEDGGPGVKQIAECLRRVSADPEGDVYRFAQANVFNWLIGGTDAHAKNYSLLIGAGDEVLLAPFYDLSSQLPYEKLIAQRLAMKIGDRYEIRKIGTAEWRKFAQACAIEEDRLLSGITGMARSLPDAMATVRDQAVADGLSKNVVMSLADQIIGHARERLRSVVTG